MCSADKSGMDDQGRLTAHCIMLQTGSVRRTPRMVPEPLTALQGSEEEGQHEREGQAAQERLVKHVRLSQIACIVYRMLTGMVPQGSEEEGEAGRRGQAAEERLGGSPG